MNNISLAEIAIIFLIVVGFLFVIALLILRISGLRLEIVSQGKQLIIYRLGLFKRIAGPGPVMLRSLEEVEQTIDVRNRPHRIPVNGLFLKGIPFGYTLEIWYRTALEESANGDAERLSQLIEFSDSERQQMVNTRVFEAMTKSAAQVEQEYQPPGNEFFYNLLPIIPGYPDNTKMMALAKQRLADAFASVGLQLDWTRDLIICGLSINDQVAAGLGRGQIVQLLREQFPHLSEEVLLQAMSSIDRIRAPYTRIAIENDGKAAVDIRTNETGRVDTRVRSQGQSGQVNEQAVASAAVAAEQEVSRSEEQVTVDDWDVLKQVPAA